MSYVHHIVIPPKFGLKETEIKENKTESSDRISTFKSLLHRCGDSLFSFYSECHKREHVLAWVYVKRSVLDLEKKSLYIHRLTGSLNVEMLRRKHFAQRSSLETEKVVSLKLFSNSIGINRDVDGLARKQRMIAILLN